MASDTAQYAIEIAASMPEGDATIAELDRLTESLLGSGKNADHFQDAIKQVGASLASAEKAAAIANAALAAGTAEYGLLERAALQASKAVEKAALVENEAGAKAQLLSDRALAAAASEAVLEKQLESLNAVIASAEDYIPQELVDRANKLTTAVEKARLKTVGLAAAAAAAEEKHHASVTTLAELSAKATAADGAVSGFSSTLKDLEGNAAGANAAEAKLGQQLKNVQKLSSHANAAIAAKAETIEKLRGGLASVPGPAGKMASSLLAPAQGFAKLSSSMGTANATALLAVTGVAALAAAVIALGVAALAGAAKIAEWAVGLADANRSASLATEAFDAMNPALAGLDFAGLARETGLGADALRKFSKELEAAKVPATDMPAALRAVALAEKALGSGAGSELVGRMRDAKGAVGDLAAEATTKLGGIVARQMLGLDAQADRFKSNVSGLFGGLNIDPVLTGMQRLVALFNKNTAAGSAMQTIFEGVFQPLINAADKASVVIEAFVLGFLIGLTKLYIAIKPAIKAVSEFFGFDSPALGDTLAIAKKLGEAVAPVFVVLAAVVGTVLAVAFATIGAVIAAQVAIWYGLIKVVQFVISVVGSLYDALGAFVSWLGSVSLEDMGRNLMMGFVNGITNSVSAVIAAVKNAVGAAIGAAKSLLGIASPSKVFASIGDFTGQGFAEGVSAAAPEAHAAMASLVSPPVTGVASPTDAGAAAGAAAVDAGGGASASGGGGGANYADMFRGATFTFGAGADGKAAAADFMSEFTRLLEGLGAQVGGEAPA